MEAHFDQNGSGPRNSGRLWRRIDGNGVKRAVKTSPTARTKQQESGTLPKEAIDTRPKTSDLFEGILDPNGSSV